MKRVAALVAGSLAGLIVSGFWHVRVVDGLGVRTFVEPIVGHAEGRWGEFPQLGLGFGLPFAAAVGLAATFTASNAATFTLLPALVRSADGRVAPVLRVLARFAAAVVAVGALYGVFIGRLGPEGAAAFNGSAIRGAQSFIVFSTIGLAMIAWALVEAGLVRLSPAARTFFSQASVRALVAGLMVGAFSIGRPLAVFREFLLYVAQPALPVYAAAAMVVQTLGTIAVAIALTTILCASVGTRGRSWLASRPDSAALASAAALSAGGTFLLFYWGISRIWPPAGRWGFQLGLFS